MNKGKACYPIAVILLTMIFFKLPTFGQVQAESYRGFYVFGHEVRTFQPCGSEKIYWVKAAPDLSEKLRKEHQKLTAKLYEPIYVEVKGYFTEKAAEGFAADYDGQIVIEALNLIRNRQEKDCATSLVAGDDITGAEWKWQQTLYNNDQRAVPGDPSHYTITFKPDGSLNIRADCNRAGGKYTLERSSLTIKVTYSTRAACPPDSLEQTFLKNLNAAAIYFMREGHLDIDLKYDTGTMKFSK